jgi:hypothetical protein
MRSRITNVLYVLVVCAIGTTLLTSGLIWLDKASPTAMYYLLIALGVIYPPGWVLVSLLVLFWGGVLFYGLKDRIKRKTAPERDTDATYGRKSQ